MKATIWHNPACGTSRKTLAILRETPGVAVEIVEYLKTPPTRERLTGLYKAAGITPHQGLRTTHSPAAELVVELGLSDPATPDDIVLDAMMAHPALIQRPLVETPKGVRLCRPQDVVREIL